MKDMARVNRTTGLLQKLYLPWGSLFIQSFIRPCLDPVQITMLYLPKLANDLP